MVVVVLCAGLLLSPFVFWFFGLTTLAVLSGIFVALCVPSMLYIGYLARKHREWPKVVGGPSITWAGKRYGI